MIDEQALIAIITKEISDGFEKTKKELVKELLEVLRVQSVHTKNYPSDSTNESGQQSVTLKNAPDFLTRGEVADILRVSLTTLDKWRSEGQIPFSKINTRIRFDKAVIEALAKEDVHKKFRERK